MRRLTPIAALFLLVLLACDRRDAAADEAPVEVTEAPTPSAEDAVEEVTLRARHELGVPLHPEERDRRLSGRLPDGERVRVRAWSEDRRWLEVEAADGTRGWIVQRYLARSAPAASKRRARAPAREAPARATGPLASREACEEATRPERGPLRVASWNIRWFPDGHPRGPSDRATDIEWLACAIANLGLDAVAVQEFMLHERGEAALSQLLASLSRRTGGTWQARFDDCPRDGRQHVGVLVDTSRLTIESHRQIDAFNPGPTGCSFRLRPGLAVEVQRGGNRIWLVSVHLDAGSEARDHRNRARSWAALERLPSILGGREIWVLGDFNTVGCRRCAPGVRAEAELADLDAFLAGLDPAWSRLELDQGCTLRSRRGSPPIDFAVVPAGSALVGARAEVLGPCALGCSGTGGLFGQALSDHCPVVVEAPR